MFSRMDFPGSLRPTVFMTGPLGLSDVPDMSFMCSWRDALTLPESLPQNSEVRWRGEPWRLQGGHLLSVPFSSRSTWWGGISTNLPRQAEPESLLWVHGMPAICSGFTGRELLACSFLPPSPQPFIPVCSADTQCTAPTPCQAPFQPRGTQLADVRCDRSGTLRPVPPSPP